MPKVAEIGAILYDFISVGGQQIFICIGGSATTSVGRMVVQSNRSEYL
jgi:glycerate kinase